MIPSTSFSGLQKGSPILGGKMSEPTLCFKAGGARISVASLVWKERVTISYGFVDIVMEHVRGCCVVWFIGPIWYCLVMEGWTEQICDADQLCKSIIFCISLILYFLERAGKKCKIFNDVEADSDMAVKGKCLSTHCDARIHHESWEKEPEKGHFLRFPVNPALGNAIALGNCPNNSTHGKERWGWRRPYQGPKASHRACGMGLGGASRSYSNLVWIPVKHVHILPMAKMGLALPVLICDENELLACINHLHKASFIYRSLWKYNILHNWQVAKLKSVKSSDYDRTIGFCD